MRYFRTFLDSSAKLFSPNLLFAFLNGLDTFIETNNSAVIVFH